MRDTLSGKRELPGMPPVDEVAGFRILYITDKGMDLHLSDDTWWPLDDEGELRKDWALGS